MSTILYLVAYVYLVWWWWWRWSGDYPTRGITGNRSSFFLSFLFCFNTSCITLLSSKYYRLFHLSKLELRLGSFLPFLCHWRGGLLDLVSRYNRTYIIQHCIVDRLMIFGYTTYLYCWIYIVAVFKCVYITQYFDCATVFSYYCWTKVWSTRNSWRFDSASICTEYGRESFIANCAVFSRVDTFFHSSHF